MAQEIVTKEELQFPCKKRKEMEEDGQEEEAGFQHQPHFVCVCVCVSFPWMLDSDVVLTHLRRREKLFLLLFITSFFLFDIYFDSPLLLLLLFPSVGFSLSRLLFLPFAEGELLLSIHPSIVPRVTAHPHKKHVCDVISNDSLFLATPLVVPMHREKNFWNSLQFFFPTLCSHYNFPFSSGISMSLFFIFFKGRRDTRRGSEGVIIQFYASTPPFSIQTLQLYT